MIRCILTKYLNDYIYIHISIYYIYVYMRITPSYDCMKLKKTVVFRMFFSDVRVLIRREIGLALAAKHKVKIDLFLGYSDFRHDPK